MWDSLPVLSDGPCSNLEDAPKRGLSGDPRGPSAVLARPGVTGDRAEAAREAGRFPGRHHADNGKQGERERKKQQLGNRTWEGVLLQEALQQLEYFVFYAAKILNHVQFRESRNILVAALVDTVQERIQVSNALQCPDIV